MPDSPWLKLDLCKTVGQRRRWYLALLEEPSRGASRFRGDAEPPRANTEMASGSAIVASSPMWSIPRPRGRSKGGVGMNRCLTRTGLVAGLAAIACTSFASSASAQETQAASCEPPRSAASSGWDYVAQGFAPSLSGPLTRAEVDITKDVSFTRDYVVEIRTVDGSGLPTDTVLATATVANASVPVGDSLLSASFPNPATVTAGQEYALVVNAGEGFGLQVGYRFDNPCPGFIAFRETTGPWDDQLFPDFDMVFRVFVTQPTPTTATPAPSAKKKCKKKKKGKRAASAKKKKCKKKKKKK